MAKKKKKLQPGVTSGVAYIKSTFNNTIITITDPEGNALFSASAGMVGFKGTRKSTPFAAQRAAQKAADDALGLGLQKLDIKTKGPGPGKEAAVRALKSTRLKVGKIVDVTPRPHNGCRLPKRRKV